MVPKTLSIKYNMYLKIPIVSSTLQICYTLKLHCSTMFYPSMVNQKSLDLGFKIHLYKSMLKSPEERDTVMIHPDLLVLEVLTHL